MLLIFRAKYTFAVSSKTQFSLLTTNFVSLRDWLYWPRYLSDSVSMFSVSLLFEFYRFTKESNINWFHLQAQLGWKSALARFGIRGQAEKSEFYWTKAPDGTEQFTMRPNHPKAAMPAPDCVQMTYNQQGLPPQGQLRDLSYMKICFFISFEIFRNMSSQHEVDKICKRQILH